MTTIDDLMAIFTDALAGAGVGAIDVDYITRSLTLDSAWDRLFADALSKADRAGQEADRAALARDWSTADWWYQRQLAHFQIAEAAAAHG